jgi:hypothetical protein
MEPYTNFMHIAYLERTYAPSMIQGHCTFCDKYTDIITNHYQLFTGHV